ncbi:SGNH/GDSL hydrolase family protein [Parerythrobacter aurantius]|uniref:SGNH/GDSL hydrolase family protein n=1 Tax=Parerythrobacter aurantius TaxID=3127706 RepID=UPI00324ACD68
MGALHIPRPAPARPALLPPQLAPLQLADPAPVITQSPAATLPRYWPSSSGSVFYPIASSVQGGAFSFCRGLPGTRPAGYGFADAETCTYGLPGQRSGLGQQWSFHHEGSRLEIEVQNNPFGFLLRVDNRFVSLEPHVTSGQTLVSVDFGSVACRRIDIISWQMAFCGIFTAPSDTIYAASLRGPRCIVFGDSFTTPDPANWPVWFGHALGWDDVWPSGVGGTGFVADGYGAALALPDRVLPDLVPYRPEVVFIQAGLNDWGKSPAAVEAAAELTVERIRRHLPQTLVVGGANTAFGIESWPSGSLDVLDAIRAGIGKGGGSWLSPVELPLAFGGDPVGVETSLVMAVPAGNPGNDGHPATVSYPNGITCNTATDSPSTNLRVGSVVEIGTGATRERVAITSVGYVAGRLIYGFDGATRYAHAVGEPVREVGPCFVTGHVPAGGETVGPDTWGNAPRFVGWDNFHYNADGNRALGAVNASLLRHHLRERASL